MSTPTLHKDDVAAVVRAKDLGPSKSDIASIPGVVIKDVPGTTKYTADISGPKALKMFQEMTRARRRAETDAGRQINGRQKDVMVRHPDGRMQPIKEEDQDMVGRATGALKVGRWGRPTKKYAQGQWWKREGGDWVPEDEV